MNTRALTYAADRLLSQVERDPNAPHYVEDSFERKLYLANQRAHKVPIPANTKVCNFLLQNEWAEVIENARLTAKQAEVLNLRLSGYTFEEIGVEGGHTKQGSQRIFFQAAKKLIKAWMEYPYRGLADVYREEISRGRKMIR